MHKAVHDAWSIVFAADELRSNARRAVRGRSYIVCSEWSVSEDGLELSKITLMVLERIRVKEEIFVWIAVRE